MCIIQIAFFAKAPVSASVKDASSGQRMLKHDATMVAWARHSKFAVIVDANYDEFKWAV